MDNDFLDIQFLTRKQFAILDLCENNYTSKICVDAMERCGRPISFAQGEKIVRAFKELGLVDTRKQGRTSIITLTPKGREVRECYQHIGKLME